MNKSLLFLGLLGFASSAGAQTTPNLGPWVLVNTTNVTAIPPGYRIRDIKTVSPNVAWIVASELGSTVPNYYFVTSNAAGTEFASGSTIPNNGAQTFQTGNISPVGLAGTPAAATTAIAATYPPMGGGGEIIRTTNGGASWTKVTTAGQFNAAQGGFCNWVHMFDASVGLSLGDPTGTTSPYYEVLRTVDGGLTWARLPQASSPVPLADEAALTRSFFVRGNTVWAGTGSGVPSNPVRVLKSTDRGLTWTVAPTTLLGSIERLAFKDDLNGIAYNTKAVSGAISEVNVIRTTDGGATWSPITTINSPTGSFFWFDIDAANGRYYSVGQRFPASTPAVAEDFGSSSSIDGITWTNINTSQGFFTFDLIASGTNNAQGYAGTSTAATGSGGIFKAGIIQLANRDAALQSALSVYPNPSANGAFTVELGSTLQAGAQVTVSDALGRLVKSQALNATAIGAKKFALDLSNEKSGVYTLQIRSAVGIATQKLVVE